MKKNWSLRTDFYKSDLTIEEIVSAIRVFESLQEKYPNDDIIATSIDILREEACNMFGGSTCREYGSENVDK
jgi:hypothetical protein